MSEIPTSFERDMNEHRPPPSNTARHAVSAGRVLVEALALHGVERVFCVPGESYLEVLDALHGQDQIELIVAKHEGAAANMAEADGKLTGRPGICMVTRGPGATHASIGVHIAQQDSTPMILFIGQIARGHRGREAFQEVDYQKMFGAIAKLVIEIDDEHRMGELMAKAFHAAASDRPGPVVVALPEDMLTATTAMPACLATPVMPGAVGAGALQSVAVALTKAQRPLLVVGGSTWSDRGIADLRAFSDVWQLPVACAFRRQDIFDNNAPNFVGHMSLGMSTALQDMIKDADLVLSVGSRLGDIPTGGYALIEPPRALQTLILSHVDAAELGRVFQADLAIQAAPDAMASALSTLVPDAVPHWGEWTRRGRAAFEAFTARKVHREPVAGVDLTEVMLHLNRALPADAVLANGAGNYSVWLHRYYRYRAPRTELASTCGAMGYGLPAAIAAALRLKSRTVVCVAGDGCFLMYPQELATAVQYGATLIVLVVNNGMYGTIRMHQERHYPGRVSGTRLQGPDYVALAKAFGAYAERVTVTGDFAGAFERARAAGGVGLIELATDPLQITPDKRLAYL